MGKRTRKDTIPAWVKREDPIFNTVAGSKLHVNCKCKDCKKRR